MHIKVGNAITSHSLRMSLHSVPITIVSYSRSFKPSTLSVCSAAHCQYHGAEYRMRTTSSDLQSYYPRRTAWQNTQHSYLCSGIDRCGTSDLPSSLGALVTIIFLIPVSSHQSSISNSPGSGSILLSHHPMCEPKVPFGVTLKLR